MIKLKKYLLTFGLIMFLGLASFVGAQTEEGPVDLLIDSPQETQEEPVDIVDNIAEETENALADNQIQEELVSPGLLPGHPLYFLKSVSEGLGNLFAFGENNQAKRAMVLAEKRLSEAQALMAQGEIELAEQAINRYQEQFSHAFSFAQRAKEKGKNTDEVMAKIAENTLRHQAVLSRVYEQVPEEAKGAIEKAMENGLRGHEQALQNISQETTEEVDQILRNIEERRPALEEKFKQLQDKGAPVPSLPSRGRSQQEADWNLIEEEPETPVKQEPVENNQTRTQKVESQVPVEVPAQAPATGR